MGNPFLIVLSPVRWVPFDKLVQPGSAPSVLHHCLFLLISLHYLWNIADCFHLLLNQAVILQSHELINLSPQVMANQPLLYTGQLKLDILHSNFLG